MEDLELALKESKIHDFEGFVVKELNNTYDETWGYKLKAEETLEGFIIAFREGTKAGKKTGLLGTVGVSLRADSTTVVAWVPIPEADRCTMESAERRLIAKKISFTHLGFGATPMRSCKFVEYCEMPKSKWRWLSNLLGK